jgi:hypothetical protein
MPTGNASHSAISTGKLWRARQRLPVFYAIRALPAYPCRRYPVNRGAALACYLVRPISAAARTMARRQPDV